MKSIIYAVAAAAFIFILFAFGQATFSIAYWSDTAREFCAMVMGITVFAVVVFAHLDSFGG